MKTRSIIAATLLSITGAAFAQGEATYEYPQAATSAKSRAEVQAESIQARAAGQIQIGEAGLPQVAFVSRKSRAEVRKETLAAVANGELHALHGDDNTFDGSINARRAHRAGTVPVMASMSK